MIDLHMHSTRSDGTDEPAALAAKVAAAGLRAAALTDHDTTAGHAEYAAELARHDIEFVPGCEISCLHEDTGTSTHVLCYFLDDAPSPLQDILAGLRDDRDNRNLRLVERVHELGYDRLSVERIEEIAGKPLAAAGRPHFAAALLEAYPLDPDAPRRSDGLPAGFSSTNDVFAGLLGTGQPGYIPKAQVTPAEATAAARRSGAVTVLAHPLITFCKPRDEGPWSLEEQRDHLDPIFEGLAADGLVGAEAYYSRHSPAQVSMLLELCDRHGLVATGGSDYHGTNKPDLEVGIGRRDAKGSPEELAVPDSALDELKARRTPPS